MRAGEGESWETVRWTESKLGKEFTFYLLTYLILEVNPLEVLRNTVVNFFLFCFLNLLFYQPSKCISIPSCCNIVSPLSASSILLFKLLISSGILFQDFTIFFGRTLKIVLLMLYFSYNNNPHSSTLLSSNLLVWMDVQRIYDSWCKLAVTGSLWCQ